MEFGLSPELGAYRDSVRAFAAARLAPHYQSDDRAGRMRGELRGELAEMGLLGLRIDERFGGQGADCVTTGMVCEELARADFNATYLVLNSLLVGEIIAAGADEEQCRRWLAPLAAGEVTPAICLTEPDRGSDAAQLELRADRDGAGWRLTGEKSSVTLGLYATEAVVFARTGGPGARGVSAFYVELDSPEVSRSRFVDLGNRAIGRASINFDGLAVGADRLIGGEGMGFQQVMRGFDYSRALIGLMCLGCAQASIDEALEWARRRVAFGGPIGRFQGVAFPLVEHATYLRAARHLCYEALWKKDQGLDHRVEANMAKWWAPKASVEAAHQALLTFGHLGYSEEVPQAQRMRDLIGLEIGDGTAQIAKLVVARQLLGRESAP